MKFKSQSPLTKWGAVFILFLLHILAMILFYKEYGTAILFSSILPVIATGWIFGLIGGIFSSIAAIVIDLLVILVFRSQVDVYQLVALILVQLFVGGFSGTAKNVYKFSHDQSAELKKRLQESEAVTQIAIALSETERIGLPNILQLIVDSAKKIIPGVEQAVIHLLDRETNQLIPEAIAGNKIHEVGGHKMKLGEGIAGQVINSGESIFISDVNNDPRFIKLNDQVKMRSLAVAPVFSGTERLGTISIQSSKPNTFTLDQSKLLSTLGIQAAIAIENAHLIENTRQALKEANALYRINQGLVASLNPDDVMKDAVELLKNNFGYYYVQIFVADPLTDNFIMRAGSGEIGEKLKALGHSLRAGEGLTGYAAETGETFFTNNVADVVSYIPNPYIPETKSELAMPVKIGDEILGVLDVQQLPPALLTQRDVQLVSAVADQLAVALQKARLHENLQYALEQEKNTRNQLVQNERLVVMGRLLATVSHELNNPLQAIQNALFLLREEKGISEQGRQDLDIVLAESEHMANMIERLRDTYRPTRTQDFHPAQINDIIESVHALIATHLRHNRISFEFQPDPDLPEIPALADQIRQVILNLFMNAAEAMSSGGTLLASTKSLNESGEILITVTDTGSGIDPAFLPNIFDAFVTNKKSGTGLGLTITYDIVMKHQGRIEAQNNNGHGTTFSIWLPIITKEHE